MAIRKEMLEAIEGKLLRHGYMYIGNDILDEAVAWIKEHERFRGYPVLLDNRDRTQSRLTVLGFVEDQDKLFRRMN